MNDCDEWLSRYGGMSFVPPPGKFSDRPLTKKVTNRFYFRLYVCYTGGPVIHGLLFLVLVNSDLSSVRVFCISVD